MNTPLVSALLATNRPHYAAVAKHDFLAQDYPNLELLVDDGEGLHGAKMDRLFQRAKGEFCVVVDDDDFYVPSRISQLIEPMLRDPEILCVGTSKLFYIKRPGGKTWLYDNATLPKSCFWMAAPAYRRVTYETFGPWESIRCGADLQFLRKIPRCWIHDLRDEMLMLCTIHDFNCAGKQPHPPAWTEVERLPVKLQFEISEMFGKTERWKELSAAAS